MKRLVATLLSAAAASAAFAGGPLYTYDPVNRIPYAWKMGHWPGSQVPVYTDLGRLGRLDNVRATKMTQFSVKEWSSVKTSSFKAASAGDFSALGLGDIDGGDIESVIGKWNGGGIHVVYDYDGSIMTDFFGLPPTAVLGIANIEYVGVESPEIVEAWAVLSGPGIHANDPNGIGFQGVITHELGHALNLGHSQANGAVWNPAVYDSPQPQDCPAPWTGGPNASQVETMYAMSNPEPGDTGEYMGTVDRLDDKSALSDLYPGPGYPGNRGSIRGEIFDPFGVPVTGVDLIARNVVDPFNDFTSYLSGQVSKGEAGPDGSFELNGLTPGAHYVVYTDGLLIGSFSVPRPIVLPGVEEYWNGGMESGDAALDDHCAWTTVTAQPGAPVTADITFNKYEGAPTLITAYFLGAPTDITPDGSVVVGGLGGPVFRWDVETGAAENIGGMGSASISDDGTKIASSAAGSDGIVTAAIYEDGVWTSIPPAPGSTPCNQDGMITANRGLDISGDGLTVVGQSYGDGCYRGAIRAFKWTAAGGTVVLPKVSSFNNMSRASGVSYDGSVIVGLDESTSGQWRGAFWKDGVARLITRSGQNVNTALDVSRDGQYIVGDSSLASSNNAWRFSVPANTVQLLGSLPSYDNAVTMAISDDYGVISGYSTSSTTGGTSPTIWTAGLRQSNFNTFLAAQGVNLADIYPFIVSAMSADGSVLTGTFASIFGEIPFVVKSPTSIVCHAPAGSPADLETTIVSFPHGLDAALAAGDTLGPCQFNANAPMGIPGLIIGKAAAGTAQLDWNAIGAATGYDLVRGSLEELRSSHGDFSTAVNDCLEDDLTGTSRTDADTPAAGDGFWYLVRAVNSGGSATFDSGSPSQVGSRDAGIQASPSSCP